MALPRQRDSGLDALIRRGVAEITQMNPHIASPPPVRSDEEVAEILSGDEALDTLRDSPEGQRAQALGYSASDAVNADRGD